MRLRATPSRRGLGIAVPPGAAGDYGHFHRAQDEDFDDEKNMPQNREELAMQ